MDEPPSTQHQPRRLAVICCAAVAAALFTPVPATAEVIEPRPRVEAAHAPDPDTMALSLISAGMLGIGLSVGGLAIVAHRRRR